MLYPQIQTTPANMIGSWDIWGYNNVSTDILRYATKDGRQMKAIMHMMKQMMGAYEEDDVKNTTRLKTSQKDNRSSARILEGDDSAED